MPDLPKNNLKRHYFIRIMFRYLWVTENILAFKYLYNMELLAQTKKLVKIFGYTGTESYIW
jgi:hypothetical protein